MLRTARTGGRIMKIYLMLAGLLLVLSAKPLCKSGT